MAELSMITNYIMDYIYNVHGLRLTEWNNDILNPGLLEMYADAVAQKGAALTNCFGFIDGTVLHADLLSTRKLYLMATKECTR